MLAPSQMFGVHRSLRARRAARSGRFVSTWKVCCGARFITSKTEAMKVSGTERWNRSDMELTKTSRGRRQPSGSRSTSAWVATSNPLAYFWTPIPRSLRDIRSA